MNDSTNHAPRAIPGLTIPLGARAVLVYESDEPGKFAIRPVGHNQSVLNLETSLLKHLNEQPLGTTWLQVLRDYCDDRLALRAAAQAKKSFITPSAKFDWDMTSIAAARGV